MAREIPSYILIFCTSTVQLTVNKTSRKTTERTVTMKATTALKTEQRLEKAGSNRSETELSRPSILGPIHLAMFCP